MKPKLLPTAKVKVFGSGEPFQEMKAAQPCTAGLSGIESSPFERER
jgi:hypothetical protein